MLIIISVIHILLKSTDSRAFTVDPHQVFYYYFLPKKYDQKSHIFDQEYDLKRSYFRAFGPIFTKKPYMYQKYDKKIINMTKKRTKKSPASKHSAVRQHGSVCFTSRCNNFIVFLKFSQKNTK